MSASVAAIALLCALNLTETAAQKWEEWPEVKGARATSSDRNLSLYYDPKPLANVDVQCAFTYKPASGEYFYMYSLVNPAINELSVASLSIDIRRAEDSQDTDTESFYIILAVKEDGTKITRTYKDAISNRGFIENTVAVGLEPQVIGWSSGISSKGWASFSSMAESSHVSPGAGVSDLTLRSHGIPTLRDYRVDPSYIIKLSDLSRLVKERGLSPEEVETIGVEFYDSLAFHGRTIGPTAPPAELVPTAFMDNLISMTTEAEKLGWITNAGIARSLQAKLDAARKKYASGNNGAAANILRALINEADAQACQSHEVCKQGQHLTPEAYALIKYNAQYLLDHVK